MASTQVLLLQLLLVSLVSASHYMGNKMSVNYKGKNPDGSHVVEIRTKATYGSCQNQFGWSCYRGNCGTEDVSYRKDAVIDSSSSAPSGFSMWCQTETIIRRNVSSDKPFEFRDSGCCWLSTRNGVSSWHILTMVNLGTRSDTRKPNRAPDIGILPFIRVPQNCPRSYKLMTFDSDGDEVRSRYGTVSGEECTSCSLPPGFYLDQDSSTLYYRHISVNSDVFAFEMLAEDFPRSSITLSYADGSQSTVGPLVNRRKRQVPVGAAAPTTAAASTTTASRLHKMPTTPGPTTTFTIPATTTTPPPPPPARTTPYTGSGGRRHTTAPLSKQPFHFMFLVDPPVSSCQEGLFLPKLVDPTPSYGEKYEAEYGKELRIPVKAQVSQATLDGIIMTGPLNISKEKTSGDEFVIKFTPSPNDLGEFFPICFAAESSVGSSKYQSEMRCVLVEVVRPKPKPNVICTETTMTVEVDKSSFTGIHESHLRLSDPSNTVCSLTRHSNSTHVVAVIPLNACGTVIEEKGDNLVFTNEITTFDDIRDVITRKHLFEVQFCCVYAKQGNVTQGFSVHRDNVTVLEKGFGTFTYQFEFYPDNQYGTMINPNSYPVEYDLGSRIYMQIEATSSVNNTELFVESCRAAPYDNPNSRPTYSIIDNGCTVEPTVQVHTPAHMRHYRFSMEAFKFIGFHDQVFISCSVMMCKKGQPNSRCSQGCINSPLPARRKREAVTQTSVHQVSQGPLRLRRSAERTEGPVMNLNLNLVFIAGCLLAAVGMISAVVMFKAKMSRVRYQPLPSHEG